MGHAKEIITIDVYGDNQGIIAIAGCVPEIAFDGWSQGKKRCRADGD